MKNQVIPSIIANSQVEMEEAINKVKDYAEYIQLDIMDGIFVANKSLDFDFQIPKTKCKFEAHLMVQNPESWINNYWEKADTILAPIETCQNPQKIIDFLKSNNKKFGFALNPSTPLKSISNFLNEIDQVLIMTVNPGAYGQEFQPKVLEKVKELRKLKSNINIEVDGGINPMSIRLALDAGANFFVSGSYLMESDNAEEAIKSLKERLK